MPWQRWRKDQATGWIKVKDAAGREHTEQRKQTQQVSLERHLEESGFCSVSPGPFKDLFQNMVLAQIFKK